MERQKSRDFWIDRSYLIALDAKGRLVLPLEIREALEIETNGKILISISSSSKTQDTKLKTVIVEITTPSDSDVANSVAFSKNGRYLRKEGD